MSHKLSARREAFRVALEKLQRGQNWQRELSYWVDESQTAQIGALTTSTGLLVGAAGPIREAVAVHGSNSAILWSKAGKTKACLDQINNALQRTKLTADKTMEYRKAAEALQIVYEDYVHDMRSEMFLAERFEHLDKTEDILLKAIHWIELGKDLLDKHNLLFVTKSLQDFAVDILKDAGVAKAETYLMSKNMTGAAQYTRLGSFAVDYAYHGTRFYLAWTNVDDILAHADNANAMASTLDSKITNITDQLATVRGELQELRNAGKDKQAQEQVLYELRQKELKDAYLAGEWFSQTTGIRASGYPIN